MRTTRTRAAAALLLTLAASLSACEATGFEEVDEITKLRVLAMRSQPAEVGPGDLAAFDALVASTETNPALSYTWELCPFNDGPDARYTCSQDPEGESIDYVISESPEAFVPYDALVAEVGSIASLCAALGELDLPDFVEPPDCTRGLPFTLRLRVEDGSGDVELAVKQVLFLTEQEAERDAANRNPELSGLLLSQEDAEGAVVLPWTELNADEVPTLRLDPTQPVRLQALANTDEAERYVSLDEGGEGEEERERLVLAWHTTRGGMERTNTYFAEDIAPGEEFQTNALNLDRNTAAEEGDEIGLYVVLRDTRGGVDFLERRLVVEFIEAAP